MLRNGQDRSLRMWKSSGRILSEYTKRVLRRADGEHRPLQMEHASWYMAIVCSSALYELNNKWVWVPTIYPQTSRSAAISCSARVG